jgi:hypothetical protein
MEDVAGVHAELMTSGNSTTFNILDEGGKPIATNGFTGSVLVVSGSERRSHKPLTFRRCNERRSQEATAITLMLKTQQGKSGQAKFKK